MGFSSGKVKLLKFQKSFFGALRTNGNQQILPQTVDFFYLTLNL